MNLKQIHGLLFLQRNEIMKTGIFLFTRVQHTSNKFLTDYVIMRQYKILRLNDIRDRSKKVIDNKDQGSIQRTPQYNVESLTNKNIRIFFWNGLDEKVFMTMTTTYEKN